MTKTPIKRNLDRIVAATLLALGLCSSIHAYAGILSTEKPAHILLPGLKLGEHNSLLTSAKRCFGTLFTKLVRENNNFDFESHSEALASYGSRTVLATFRTKAHFNPLGQMFESASSIQAENLSIDVSTSNINPIKVMLTAKLGTHNIAQEFEVPGPFLIKSEADTFQFEYGRVRAGQSNMLNSVGANITGNIDLKVEPSNSTQLTCLGENSGPLDLTTQVNSLRAAVAPLAVLVPETEQRAKND